VLYGYWGGVVRRRVPLVVQARGQHG
jgi:hypothetical protein